MLNDNQKSTKTFFTLIFLPLLISAVWEKILSPLFDRALEGILAISNSLFTGISNRIYTNISYGVKDSYSPIVCSLLFGALCAITLISLSNSYELYQSAHLDVPSDNDPNSKADLNEDDQESSLFQFHKSRFLFTFSILFAIVAHLFVLVYLIKQSYVDETAQKLTNNIEIVSPYISDLEYKRLKSEFYSMHSRSDYDDLITKLETIGSENHLNLK